MKALDFLKGKVSGDARIFVVSGSEAFLRRQVAEKIRRSFKDSHEVVVLDGGDAGGGEALELRDFLDDLRMESLFGERRLIHLKRADSLVSAHKKILQHFIQAGEAVHPLIMEGEKLAPRSMKVLPKTGLLGAVVAKGGLIITCAPLFDRPFAGRGPAWQSPLSRYLTARARQLGKQLSMQDACTLHSLVGTSLERLDQELKKLVLFVGERGRIEARDIEGLVSGSRQSAVFLFSQAMGGGDWKAALKESRLLFERGVVDAAGRTVRDPARVAAILVRTVARRLEKIFLAREILDEGRSFEEAAAEVKESPWGRERLRSQVEFFRSPQRRSKVLTALLLLERNLKSSAGAPRLLLDRFVVEALAVEAVPS